MEAEKEKTGFSTKQTIALVLAAVALTAGIGILILWLWIFPRPFTPVALNPAEETHLRDKLTRLEQGIKQKGQQSPQDNAPIPTLPPEAYSEKEAVREIVLTQREVNAMIAHNTDLADKVAVHFSDNLISLNLRIPLEEDFPFLGGKILRVNAGAELAFRNERPVVILRGVSVMGVPVPKAWLGELKNIDLVETFGAEPGFWRSFAGGIASIRVSDGELALILKE